MNYRQYAASAGRPGGTTSVIVAADTTKTLVAAKTNYTFYIQRITYVPTTVNAATIAVTSLTTTTARYALVPASAATPYSADFGPEGLPTTAGEGLVATPSAAGPAGVLHVEGYYKLTSVISYLAGASLQ